jgi:hypothetical protein
MTEPVPRRCAYAGDPTARPDCQLSAVVCYGSVALCPSCDRARSTLGKGITPRRLPAGPPLDPLDWINTTERELRAAADLLAAAVTRARQHGHTWTAIGHALGVSRQAAQQRFGPRDPPAEPTPRRGQLR